MSPEIDNPTDDRFRLPMADQGSEIHSRRSFIGKMNTLMFRFVLAAAAYDVAARVIDPQYSLKRISTPLRRRFFPNSR
jgi:hypothetical protein